MISWTKIEEKLMVVLKDKGGSQLPGGVFRLILRLEKLSQLKPLSFDLGFELGNWVD